MKWFYIGLILFLAQNLYSQVDTSAWNRQKEITFEEFKIKLPSIWTEDTAKSDDMILKYDGTGKGYPYFWNGAPAEAKFIVKRSKESVKNTVKKIIESYPKMPDNFFYPDTSADYAKFPPFGKKEFYEPVITDIKLKTGFDAKLIKKRNYQKKNRLFFTLYDLVLSPVKNKTIVISFVASHYDKTFSIEQIFNLDNNLRKCFDTFEPVH